jgi:hypothetical protein
MWPGSMKGERRVRTSMYLPHLTVADGEWLAKTLPVLQRNARPEPHAVQVEDIALRYRSGHLGIADALDATSELLAPLAAAGASIEHRGEWYISDDDDEDQSDLFETDQPTRLAEMPREDLLVSARFVVDAAASDAGAAALYWAVLGLTDS